MTAKNFERADGITKRYFHLVTDAEYKALGDKRWCDLPGLG